MQNRQSEISSTGTNSKLDLKTLKFKIVINEHTFSR